MRAQWIFLPLFALAVSAQAAEINDRLEITRSQIRCTDIPGKGGYGTYRYGGYGDPDERTIGSVQISVATDNRELRLSGSVDTCGNLLTALGGAQVLQLIVKEKHQVKFGEVISTTYRVDLGQPSLMTLSGTIQI